MLRKIIVGYDGSPAAGDALAWALDEADRTRAPVELIHADDWPAWTPVGDPSSGSPPPDSSVVEVIGGMMERAITAAKRTHPMVDLSAKTVHAVPAQALIDRSRRAALVVVGGRGHSAVAELLGSVSSAVSAHAHCPVVVVRGSPASYAAVVAGVDDSLLASPILDLAAAQASAHRVPLRVIRAWAPATSIWQDGKVTALELMERERGPFDALVTDLRDIHPNLKIEAEALVEHPAAALTRESAGARLVVVGSRGRGAVRGLVLGSVSQHLLRHSTCSVAVIHDTLMRA
ncbi:nucleotide-binding universal stress UspA family protein [Actinoplanes octamycinicus]|uniref:Nucleotide-binding universal stress UspA family protein n=1 Tax=Actinoplanes octamycinicus TaxID=135948 RepID=A0A7W7H2N6_9ACTN|nr:universal stress protein [Actinoplanes octamycinicus]MBB4742881.1 nucleotide-binding universal stress UspA family protein [Actinoplanes octamycinicus]GIE58266.1 universal stress protein [Actinoplanes octamycinicus]